jgi:hypothetical protein
VTLLISAALMLGLNRYDADITIEGRFIAVTLLLLIAGGHLWSLLRHHDVDDASQVRGAGELLQTASASC